jgi:hypothetical protein
MPRRDQESLHRAVAVCLLTTVVAVVLGLSFEAGRQQGVTADEPWFLRYGARFVETGNLTRFSRSAAAPLPVLLAHVPAVLLSTPRIDSHAPNPACGDGREVLRLARALNAAVIGIPLLLAVFTVLARRHDLWAGVAGAAIVGLSPSVLAGLSLATTDACITLFVFLSVATLAWHARSGSLASLACLSISVGLAIGAKLSGLFLGPIAALVIAASPAGLPAAAGRRYGSVIPRIVARMACMALISLVVAWGVSGFQLGVADDSWLGTPELLQGHGIPAPVLGLLRHIDHSIAGHPAFLMGSLSTSGWWSYFPVVFAIKSTPAELILLAPTFALAVWGLRRWRELLSGELGEPSLWLLVVGVYGATALVSTINLGHRHLLPLYPLLACLAIEGLWRLVPNRRLRTGAVVTIVVLQAISVAGIRPSYPQYFNAFAGGPEHGYEFVVDSNVDWGQDLPALEQTLTELGGRRPGRHPRVQLFYWGRDCPSDYAIERVSAAPGNPSPDFVALSVTYLQGVYVNDRFLAFRNLEPVARAGHSILVYDYADSRVRAATAAALARGKRIGTR